jgi:hypothetical protein
MFPALQSAIARRFGCPDKVKGLPQSMRLPSFLHQKNPHRPQLVRIVDGIGDPARPPYTVQEVIEGLGLALDPIGQAQAPSDPDGGATYNLSAAQFTELRSAPNYIRTDDRGDWIATGMALRSLGDVGRELWLTNVASCTVFIDGNGPTFALTKSIPLPILLNSVYPIEGLAAS